MGAALLKLALKRKWVAQDLDSRAPSCYQSRATWKCGLDSGWIFEYSAACHSLRKVSSGLTDPALRAGTALAARQTMASTAAAPAMLIASIGRTPNS